MEKKLLERILQIRDVELPRNRDEIKRVRSLPNFFESPEYDAVKCEQAQLLSEYFAVIDKLQKAKSVDPSIAEEADKLIRTYSAYTPKDEDLFFIGIKKGDAVTIGGWIGETTTVR